jgi:hypothetical protein
VLAHKIRRLLYSSLAEATAKLPDELLAHQLNLLCTLNLDSFGIDTRLLLQLRGDSL